MAQNNGFKFAYNKGKLYELLSSKADRLNQVSPIDVNVSVRCTLTIHF
jgi:hypothetical protein